MSGTPGTMNKAHANNGCQGVLVSMNDGNKEAMLAFSERNELSHATIVEMNAPTQIQMYVLAPFAPKNIRNRKPRIAANDA